MSTSGSSCSCPLTAKYTPPPPLLQPITGGDAGDSLIGATNTGETLPGVSTDTGECSEKARRENGGACSSAQVLAVIGDFVKTNASSAFLVSPVPDDAASDDAAPADAAVPDDAAASNDTSQILRSAEVALGCTTEACVIKHPQFRSFVSQSDLDVRSLDVELGSRFKPSGPRNTVQWLSSDNIDSVLQQWAAAFPKFFNHPYNMIDFEKRGGSLSRVSVDDILEGRAVQSLGAMQSSVRRPCDHFGCVVNTDVSSGSGKHWVAVFGDMRGKGSWSIEYFNSAGNAPPVQIAQWMENIVADLVSFRSANHATYGVGDILSVPVTNVRHQNSNSECGLYALYYLRRRIEGGPASAFRSARIPDEDMTAFRRHVFRED
jgi:hypothetical protein